MPRNKAIDVLEDFEKNLRPPPKGSESNKMHHTHKHQQNESFSALNGAQLDREGRFIGLSLHNLEIFWGSPPYQDAMFNYFWTTKLTQSLYLIQFGQLCCSKKDNNKTQETVIDGEYVVFNYNFINLMKIFSCKYNVDFSTLCESLLY